MINYSLKHVYVMYSFLNFATALRPLMLFYQPLGTLIQSTNDDDDDDDVSKIQPKQNTTKNIAKTDFQYHASSAQT